MSHEKPDHFLLGGRLSITDEAFRWSDIKAAQPSMLEFFSEVGLEVGLVTIVLWLILRSVIGKRLHKQSLCISYFNYKVKYM